MEREEVLDLVDSATLQAIKTLTTKRSLMKLMFFEIENVPKGFSILKILSFIRNHGNLNFITFLQKRLLENRNDSCSWIIGCRNSCEYNQFLYQFKEFSIDGCSFIIKAARRELDARYALISNPSLINTKLKAIRMSASPAYNKFFPSERMMEMLIESETNSILNLVDGILLHYKHTTRMVNHVIYVSTFNQRELSKLQRMFTKMGNKDVSFLEGSIFLLDKTIWCRQMTRTEEEDIICIINENMIQKNIITNGSDLNSIRNSLM
jgi:hypothetical protein